MVALIIQIHSAPALAHTHTTSIGWRRLKGPYSLDDLNQNANNGVYRTQMFGPDQRGKGKIEKILGPVPQRKKMKKVWPKR